VFLRRACSIALLGLLGCAKKQLPLQDPSQTQQTTCSHIILYDFDSKFTEAQKADVIAAADAWTEGTGHRHCFFHNESIKTAFFLKSEAALHFRLTDSKKQMCALELNSPACEKVVGLWAADSRSIWLLDAYPEWRRLTASHEIGHMLGLAHREIPGTVMHADITDTNIEFAAQPVPLADREEYFRLWRNVK